MIKENFIKLYENSFRENWDLPCYTDYGEDTQYTYGEVAEKIARLHLLFKHCSLRRGDKISVIGKNNAHWCIAYMATITYGAIIVPILHPGNFNEIIITQMAFWYNDALGHLRRPEKCCCVQSEAKRARAAGSANQPLKSCGGML